MIWNDKDWERLNAYMDGELDHKNTAAVARSIACDAELASAAASLAHLKSALLDQQELSPNDLAPLPPVRPNGKSTRRPLAYMTAAAVALVLCLAVTTAYWGVPDISKENSDVWIRQAIELHRDWVVASSEEQPSSLAIPAIGTLTAAEIRIPDLTDSGLTPIHLSPLNLDGVLEGYRIGYGGSRGCRISLFVLRSTGSLSEQLPLKSDNQPRASAWQYGKARYILLAQGMAEPRFELITQALKDITAGWKPLSARLRMALRSNRRVSAPCMA